MKHKLEKPWPLFIIGLTFIISPIGNIIYSLIHNGIENWYSPFVWFQLFKIMSYWDLLISLLTLLAGVALFYQRKISWFFAICVVGLIMIYNFISPLPILKNEMNFNFLLLLGNITILLILIYFRYPYLDKRDHLWKGPAKRHPANISIDLAGVELPAKIISLSKSGCFVALDPQKEVKLAPNEIIKLKLDDATTISLEISYQTDKGIGGRFKDLNDQQKDKINTLINGYDGLKAPTT